MATAKKTAAGTWRILVYAGTVDGKRHYKSITKPTKREAELAALEFHFARPPVSNMTLRDAYRQYVIDRPKLSPSTLREYDRIAEHSDSPLMTRRISDIRPVDLDREVKRLEKIYAPKSVRNRVGLFTAVMREYMPEVAFHPKLPKKRKADVYIPEEDVIVRLYHLLLNYPDKRLLIAFLLASQCGLRASEVAAMFYRVIDYEGLRIHVCAAIVQGKGGQVLKGTKSDAGDRWVPVSQFVLDIIGTGDPDERVVNMSGAWISCKWHRFMIASGEKPFSFHKLRHFFCSRALLAGVPLDYVVYFMGHASKQMVEEVYGHVFPSARERFADTLTETALFRVNATENATDSSIIP